MLMGSTKKQKASTAGSSRKKKRCEPPRRRAPESDHKKLSIPSLSSSAVQTPPPDQPGELTEDQTEQATAAAKALGSATGVGDNKKVAFRIFSQFNSMLLSGTDPATTLFMLAELQPTNILEALLITQMIGTHEAALAFLRTSIAEDQGEFRDQNVGRSNRLMRLFMEQLEQLQRMRGTGRQQRVTVEHVHVNAGGQAIVGVAEGRRGEGVNKKNEGMTP